MRCSFVLENLKAILGSGKVDNTAVEELISLGLVVRAPANESDVQLDNLKSQLMTVKGQIKALKGQRQDGLYYSSGTGASTMEISKRLEILQAQELQLRNQILSIVQDGAKGMSGAGVATTGSSAIALTYKGKEALQIIDARMPEAADMDWYELVGKLERFRARLSSEARESAEILKIISPKLKYIEEYHLRSASVGLASIEGNPAEKAEKFVNYAEAFKHGAYFGNSFAALAAEAAVANEVLMREQPQTIINDALAMLGEILRNKREPGPDTQYKALAILMMTKPIKDRPDMLHKIEADMTTTGSILGSGLMLFDEPSEKVLAERKAMFRDWLVRLPPRSDSDHTDSIVASALLSTANSNAALVTEKFNQSEAFMRELFDENMFTAAATIALWPATVDETLDNLRLSSAEILNNKLSIGGLENFSLGMKLLAPNADFITLENASAADRSARVYDRPVSSGLGVGLAAAGVAAGIAVASVAILASPLLTRMPFMVFHAVTLQEYAVQDFRYHPVHSHYLYG